ncbi:hypothetical protein [Paenibacillus hexagrammi]|uniref:Uncharacterized protein n=1 Tax=Paenibacillus hexagrammi TaxID=2908839 RepID=A0ABY3SHE3_9BACL|nr:hypothetical protein [Paenibacillus sp. YPD9-1]UJF32631.1 hypothetical protein L0M14_23855 [Paenibacillus sp. YPD9-1]
MNIYATVKSIGKRKPSLMKKEYNLASKPNTLKELLTEVVVAQVKLYNERAEESQLIPFLTKEDIEARGTEGKVAFGTRYDERQADEAAAVHTALLAFEDGLYRVFIGDEEVTGLETEIDILDGADITFIKFTMLAGRLW